MEESDSDEYNTPITKVEVSTASRKCKTQLRVLITFRFVSRELFTIISTLFYFNFKKM